ncbi:MAG: serine O-acetyltransferase [Candidatus Bathyarchaeia archaeon]
MTRGFMDYLDSIMRRDPAASSRLEVLLCYPGLHAVLAHKVAHKLWVKGFKLLARLISHLNRFFTGIEIHPGAEIGSNFFIDHGMGVVIGETAVIGNNVTMYQGVTLGGTSMEKRKRHPTVEDDVVIGAGAKVLGNIVIGAGSKIGGGSVVVESCPPNSIVVGVPGRPVPRGKPRPIIDLEHGELPDPVVEALNRLNERIICLEEKVKTLEKGLKLGVPKA